MPATEARPAAPTIADDTTRFATRANALATPHTLRLTPDTWPAFRRLTNFPFAEAFAASNNTLDIGPLSEVLHPHVAYRSTWNDIKIDGRDAMLAYFANKYLTLQARSPASRYCAQVVAYVPIPGVAPQAAVYVRDAAGTEQPALVFFGGRDGLIRGLTVTPRFNPAALTLFNYFPPDR